jgi:hypothetical protein
VQCGCSVGAVWVQCGCSADTFQGELASGLFIVRVHRRGGAQRGEKGEGPVRRRLRELGGVKAMVVGAFAEHCADVHELVDELAAAGPQKAAQEYLLRNHRAKGAMKALLYAAFGASARRALSALILPPAGFHRSAMA